jgi:hypothetical protein
MRIALVLVIAACCLAATAQNTKQPPPRSLMERACAGESSAETEIEETGDTQDLRRMMHDPECVLNGGARATLATRGDPEALQFYACRSLTNNLEVMEELLRWDFPRIGGEFEIEVYRQLLDSDQRFHADFTKHQDDCSDCIITPLSVGVTSMLQRLLPDAPIPPLTPLQRQENSQAAETVKSMWKSWIDNHQAELRQMKPTTEGISFSSESCSAVADLSTLERRLRAIAGEQALVCGPATPDSHSTKLVNKCAWQALVDEKAFYAWYVLGGSVVWNTAVAIAEDAEGNVFVVSFDDAGASVKGLTGRVERLDNGDSVVVTCPKPIKLRESFTGSLTCVTQAGSLRLSAR